MKADALWLPSAKHIHWNSSFLQPKTPGERDVIPYYSLSALRSQHPNSVNINKNIIALKAVKY